MRYMLPWLEDNATEIERLMGDKKWWKMGLRRINTLLIKIWIIIIAGAFEEEGQSGENFRSGFVGDLCDVNIQV